MLSILYCEQCVHKTIIFYSKQWKSEAVFKPCIGKSPKSTAAFFHAKQNFSFKNDWFFSLSFTYYVFEEKLSYVITSVGLSVKIS